MLEYVRSDEVIDCVISCTLKKASRFEVESRSHFFGICCNNEWLGVVFDEDTLKMINGSSLLLAEDADDKR